MLPPLHKRWRYLAVFGERHMLCAAHVRVGPLRQSFWALLDRTSGTLRERVHVLRHDAVRIDGARLEVRDRGLRLSILIDEGAAAAFEARCLNAGRDVFTRKRAGMPATGTLTLDGEPPQPLAGLAVSDESCGRHPRVTEWRWAAGAGESGDGRRVAWNLVAGVNDPPRGSERAVWVDGVPHEVGPVRFDADLGGVGFSEDGAALRFEAEAERVRRDRLLLVSSEYRQPFGRFSGVLPGGLELRSGLGVMEHHRARW